MDYEQRKEMGRNFIRMKHAEKTINFYRNDEVGQLDDFYQRQIKFYEDMAESYRKQLTDMGATEEQLAHLEACHKEHDTSKVD